MTETLSDDRHLDWPSCFNARDLGGLPTIDGGETQWRAIVRSDMLRRLTSDGVQALQDYGIRTVIDLRAPAEAQAEPSVFGPKAVKSDGPAYLNLPLETYEPAVSALISQAGSRDEVYCIVLDHYPAMMAAVFRAIARAQPGGVVFHCHAGKDRTGMVAALLLSLAAVPRHLIAADYALSQERLWPLYEQLVTEAGGEDKIDFWLKPTVTPQVMLTVLDHLDRVHGGVVAYLTAAGLTTTELARLRRRVCG